MDTVDKLLKKYVEKFNENFPNVLLRSIKDEEELINLLLKAIETNKPCEVAYQEGA